MVRLPHSFQAVLSGSGVALGLQGANGVALRQGDALRALEALRGTDLLVFGGDVHWLCDGAIEDDQSNWHCEPRPREGRAVCSNRCLDEARAYIEAYPTVRRGEPLFVLVVGEWRYAP